MIFRGLNISFTDTDPYFKAIDEDPTLDRWAAMKAELDYRYTRLLGGAILT